MQAPDPPPFDEARDATRRTRLANERTYLAWWRTGLTAFAVSVGSGKLVPALTGGTSWPYEALGAAFAVLGVACVLYAFVRQRAVEAALRRGEFAPPEPLMLVALTVAGALLGVALTVVVALGT
jgi:putative membrane protein